MVLVMGLRLWKSEAASRERRSIGEGDKALSANVGDFDFENIPFEEALQRLAERAAVPIVLNRYAVMAEGVPENVPIHLKLRGVNLRQALQAVVTCASADIGHIVFRPMDGIVLVSSARDGCMRAIVLRMYDVRDILGKLDEGDYMLNKFLPNMPRATAIDQRDDQMGTKLTELVQKNVDPALWFRTGPMAEVEFGRLWVTHTPEVQANVEVYLRELRNRLGARPE